MASTTLMPLDPAMSPQRLVRILSISADLLPDEIAAGRRAKRSRGLVMVALAVVVVLLTGWYVWAVRDVNAANDDLSAATGEVARLQKDQAKHQRVVGLQDDSTAIANKLKTLLAADLPYATLLDRLRRTGAASGVTISGVSAMLTDKNSVSPGLPDAKGTAAIGSVTITGTAPDKPSVAKYVDALSRLGTMVLNPYLTSVAKEQKKSTVWDFQISVQIAASLQCGRFTTACATGGK